MSSQKVTAFACHIAACLFFQLAVTLGYKVYIAVLDVPVSRGGALGLAVQLFFAAFVLANVFIEPVENLSAKIFIAAALVVANLAYLLPQKSFENFIFRQPLRVLTLAAVYLASAAGLSRPAGNQ